MAVHTEEVQEMSQGFTKKIEASALNLILDNLQRYQYQYPIKSTLREIVCNGIDSIADRESALDILSKGAPVSKYYTEIEGDLYSDSKFDPDYYDPTWLSNDPNIYITYHVGEGVEKDQLVIKDNGTGLGGKRLQGYFNLGYSTKRLSKLPLGKFGIGAKSPLSVGVDCYTTESRYNGKLFRFNIYSHGADSIVPKFNMKTGVPNKSVLFGEPGKEYTVYYEDTVELNGVTISIDAKKHHKQSYIDALKTQLLYFANIVFQVQQGSAVSTIEYQAQIIYEDDSIVISNNTVWSKPHLLLNKVNYGYINYDELELENKNGNIGIKVKPEDIEINPSREAVIWSDKTKKKVLERYRDVVKIASTLIQQELKTEDFGIWLQTCSKVLTSGFKNSSTSLLQRLAPIVDSTQLELHFSLDQSLVYKNRLLEAFSVKLVSCIKNRRANKNTVKVDRESASSYDLGNHPLYLLEADHNISPRRDKYIYQGGGSFVTIKAPKWFLDLPEDSTLITQELVSGLNFGEKIMEMSMHPKFLVSMVLSAVTIWGYLNKSKVVTPYTSVIVPDDFKSTDTDEEEEEVDEVARKQDETTAADRRATQGTIIVHTLRHDVNDNQAKRYHNTTSLYAMQSIEISPKTLSTWENPEIYYGNDADVAGMHLIAFLTRDSQQEDIFLARNDNYRDSGVVEEPYFSLRSRKLCLNYGPTAQVRVIKVAQSLNKLVRNFQHVTQFFISIKNNKVSMSNRLVQWNTARYLKDNLHKLNFLYNYRAVDESRWTDYHRVIDYVGMYYNEVENHVNSSKKFHNISPEVYSSLVSHLDKVWQFQSFILSKPDPADIPLLAAELFNGNNQIQDAIAVDTEIWDIFQNLLEYSEPISDFLNEMQNLTGFLDSSSLREANKLYDKFTDREPVTLTTEVLQQICAYLEWKGVA